MTVEKTLRALTESEHEAYERDGYHVARGLLSAEEVAEIKGAFMAQAKGGPVEGLSETGRITDPSDPLHFYPRMMQPHHKPAFPLVQGLSKRYLLDRRVHDILVDLFGEEPIAAQTMFYFKPPGSRGQDLHQDNFYLRIKPGSCMAAWVAIDDADRENGGMVVVPGSHRMDVACPRESDRSVFFTGDRVDVPEGKREKPADLKAGDVLFFNGSVIHGSYPNESQDRFRRAFICHYAPASCSEVARSYPLYNFDGEQINRASAEGGGPCGEVHEAPKSASAATPGGAA